ncbi:DUF4435 domain-containing protein [Leuconostoc suionicum]|uniref:DUF4435 domain-containing protein n=1 Tax=Leuconostoc suionicum TaxID=1511761 RepID=UPI001B8BD9DC|nr:AAA family ATPase [Leuconostoc suionicum]MBS1008088.1 AAA family ATPase [Leuconostoc suionicum]
MIQEKINELKKNIEKTLVYYSSYDAIQLGKFKDNINLALDKLIKLAALSGDNAQLCTSIEKTLGIFDNQRHTLMISKDINTSLEDYIQMVENNTNNYLMQLQSDIERLEYLKIIQDKNVVIVGGNGVGKSSFASYLKDALTDNIIMIPAQKYLYTDFSDSSEFITASQSDINTIQKEDMARKAKISDNLYDYNRKNRKIFAELITVLVNEHILITNDYFGSKEDLTTQLTTLKKVWSIMFPNIKLVEDPIKRILNVQKGSDIYSINSLSDGEKAVLYYMLQILFVPTKSFIFIDEPETYLNSTISDRLWDTLEAERQDVKFIYISHNVSFISSRKDTDILWIKKFTYPNTWELKELEDTELPRELISELAGTQKPVIFVEGTISSYDYTVFTSMFKELAIVFPVEGHLNVINYTRAYNKSKVFNTSKAFGVIDNDLRVQDEIDNFEKEGIYTLPFNEIEMLYFDETLMKQYLEDLFYPEDEVKERIDKFKESFFSAITKRKQYIKENKAKKILDTYLSNQRVEVSKGKTSDQMVEQIVDGLNNLSLSSKIEDFTFDLEQVIESANYSRLLVLSPLKAEISRGKAVILDSNYMDKMSNKFKRDPFYTNYLKETYFSKLNQSILEFVK